MRLGDLSGPRIILGRLDPISYDWQCLSRLLSAERLMGVGSRTASSGDHDRYHCKGRDWSGGQRIAMRGRCGPVVALVLIIVGSWVLRRCKAQPLGCFGPPSRSAYCAQTAAGRWPDTRSGSVQRA